ncbi:photosystem II reaction center protein Ycf12/Psb30 [Gloeomargarita lithophora]|nr:photosystem II reaction center protein Ycf12 [Gloeomargarita lithophora]WAS05538.1 photosystem II reaction center protein Ycf12 [Gloeomargaritales cyanobacterium VI4D9]
MSALLDNWELLVQLVLIALVVLAGPAVIFLLVARNGNL